MTEEDFGKMFDKLDKLEDLPQDLEVFTKRLLDSPTYRHFIESRVRNGTLSEELELKLWDLLDVINRHSRQSKPLDS